MFNVLCMCRKIRCDGESCKVLGFFDIFRSLRWIHLPTTGRIAWRCACVSWKAVKVGTARKTVDSASDHVAVGSSGLVVTFGRLACAGVSQIAPRFRPGADSWRAELKNFLATLQPWSSETRVKLRRMHFGS